VPHVLHLIKDPANATALEVIRVQAADPGVRVSIVLMQDAVRLAEPLPGQVYRLQDGHPDLPARPGPPGSAVIGTTELLDLIFAADSIVTW
jgi:hypothetical protein